MVSESKSDEQRRGAGQTANTAVTVAAPKLNPMPSGRSAGLNVGAGERRPPRFEAGDSAA